MFSALPRYADVAEYKRQWYFPYLAQRWLGRSGLFYLYSRLLRSAAKRNSLRTLHGLVLAPGVFLSRFVYQVPLGYKCITELRGREGLVRSRLPAQQSFEDERLILWRCVPQAIHGVKHLFLKYRSYSKADQTGQSVDGDLES